MNTANTPLFQYIIRRIGRVCLAGMAITFTLAVLTPTVLHADRSSAQGDPGLMLEKAGKYAEAAMYYQRALRGLQEVWVRFWYYGDLSKAHEVMQQIIAEYQDRLKRCLQRAKMGPAQREQMEFVNELWMGEYVDVELGGYKLAFAYRAEESEKHGDFLFAEKLRLAAADYCRLVAVPYHEQLASKLDKQQRSRDANPHRKAAEEYKQQALEHEMLAKGDKILAEIPGLQGPPSRPDAQLLRQHYFKSYKLYHQRVLSAKGGKWITGRTPQQVAAILTQQGLKHAEENARFASAVILENLGEKETLLIALSDQSPQVRLAAAKALAAIRWADGWVACYQHTDAKVRKLIEQLLEPAENQALSRPALITELLRGLESLSAETGAFCQDAMQRITGRKEVSRSAWQEWWKAQGNAKPGLIRTGPDGAVAVDETIDLGTWWQSGERSIMNRPNPLSKYSLPAKIQWRGYLMVTRAGAYQFYVRNRGEQRKTFDKHGTLYFTSPCAKLSIDGNSLLANPSAIIEDAKMHMRIDCSKPISLQPGLHTILLELDVKNAGTGPWESPSIRLYWSSEHFRRQLVPAAHLVHLNVWYE